MAIDINALLKTIKDGISELAKETFSEFVKEAGSDAENTFNSLKADIELWTKQLKNGALSLDDLKFLIRGKVDLLKISALTQIGAAQIKMDKFKQGVVDIVISSIASIVK